MKEKACKECNRIGASDICKVCRQPMSPSWMGYVRVIDPEKSNIAQKLKLSTKGRFALRVR
ncbi:MAG: transcription elongation factor subunit Spt4 [Candidatus Hydrothermarchaeales archaeon]